MREKQSSIFKNYANFLFSNLARILIILTEIGSQSLFLFQIQKKNFISCLEFSITVIFFPLCGFLIFGKRKKEKQKQFQWLRICLSIYLCLSICLPIHPSVNPSIHPSIYLSMDISIWSFYSFIYVSTHCSLSTKLSIHLPKESDQVGLLPISLLNPKMKLAFSLEYSDGC